MNTFSRSFGFAVHAGTNAMTNLGGIAIQRGMSVYKNINNRANNFATPKITPNSVNSQLLHNDDDN